MPVQVILISANGNPINGGPKVSYHLQQVLSVAESIKTQRQSRESNSTSTKKRIEEEDILAAIAIGGGRASEILMQNGKVDPNKLCKHLKIDRGLIHANTSTTHKEDNLQLSVINDLSIMAAFYLQKALQLAEIAGDAEVKTEHLLYTALGMNRTATAPRLVRDITGDFHDPIDNIKKALGYDQHHYALFKAKRHLDF